MAEGRSITISTEGSIAIFLALVGLLGTGAIMVAPQQLWIGWGLIAFAVIGFLALGLYHFRGRVRSPAGQALVGAIALAVILSGEYGYFSGYFENWIPLFGSVSSPPPISVGPTLPPGLPIQSKLERFVFACDIPPPRNSDEETKQKEKLQKNIRVWADTFGVNVAFADIENGMRITADAKTLEAKARFASMGIAYGITRIIVEARRSRGEEIIVARAEIPKSVPMIYGVTPDPSAPEIFNGRQLIAQFLEVPVEACRLV